jgi:sulfide:quinone oxidoreductase
MPGFERVRVVIAGGGVAALEAALALRALAGERVSVELVAPEREFVYKPLAVAEPFRVADMRRFPLRPLVEAAGAGLRHGRVRAVDPARNAIVTAEGEWIEYDQLLLALGAIPREAIPGALTFRGPDDTPALAALLERAVAGELSSLAFAIPVETSWPLPFYELAFLSWTYLRGRCTMNVALTLATAEDAPLGLFGLHASEAVRTLFGIRGIGLHLRAAPVAFREGILELASGDRLAVSAVVAAPRLHGPRLPGVPCDRDGFVPTDAYGLVHDHTNIYAAGDLTTFPLKQGGIASQQADTAAASIAAAAGATIQPAPFRPVLRGLLLTGLFPRYLRADPTSNQSEISTEPLWWPPAKIVGHHLAPFLATRLGLPDTPPPPNDRNLSIEIPLSPSNRPGHSHTGRNAAAHR